MIKYERNQHFIFASLSDQGGQSVAKTFGLNVTVLNRPEENMEGYRIVKPAEIIILPTFAKIEGISMFGEVDIIFNNTDHVLKQVDLERFDNKTIDIYIKPEDKWNEWYNEDRANVNFTWSVKELTSKKMRIKMDF
jgi:hypothetical protein